MKLQTRMTLTVIPSLIVSAFLLLLGWIPLPANNRLRIFGLGAFLYFSILWVDWLIHRAKTEQP